jgi:hypothetical protein
MPFEGDVVVKPILPSGRRWELMEAFHYQAKTDRFTIPAGFTTDFASVPRVVVWLLPRYGRWTQAAILHDYLWHLAHDEGFSKADADGIFNRAMRELGVPYLRRWTMWAAVRWASGPRWWLAKGPLDLIKMTVIALPALAFVALPVAVLLVALVLGALAETITYLPLRLIRRDQTKQVNKPDASDILLT